MTRETRDILIGLATLTVLALVMAYLYGGRRIAADAGQMHLSAVFNRVDGLFVGDPVHLSGIPVGRVEGMTLNDHYRPVVRFSMRDDIKLPTDSSASIQTDGLFGSKFVVLQPGGEFDNLENGGRISYTQDAVVVSDLLDLVISEGEAARAKGRGGSRQDGPQDGPQNGEGGQEGDDPAKGFIEPLGGSGQ